MKNDQTFIDIFLQFMNDKAADARSAESRFMKHPYVKAGIARGFPFQQSFDVDNYVGLQRDIGVVLNRVRRGTNRAQREEIVVKLNDLALKIPLRDAETGNPIFNQSGKPMEWPILGIANFQLAGRAIDIGAEPVVNGMEFACWYALLLISRQPKKIERCARRSCKNWFNRVTTGAVGYCSSRHAEEAEKLNARIRSHNRRHPDDKIKPVIATAPKRRRKHR
jgi:hypothetical protein